MADDGQCFIQPLLITGISSGHASSQQLGTAAFTLLQQCVIDQGVGGVAGDVGGDNNLLIAMEKYEPHVRCDRSAAQGPPWVCCIHAWADMRAGQQRQVFGRAGDPRVQESLPVTFKVVDARC